MTKANLYNRLLAPVVTEKGGGGASKYAFKVPLLASKKAVAEAVEGIFSVKVKKVNTLRMQGKKKVFRGHKGKRPDWKKAVVTLEKNQTIDVMGG